MKCPHCGYEHGWSWEANDGDGAQIEGDKGDFFELPVRVERKEFFNRQSKDMYACPKCGILFADV